MHGGSHFIVWEIQIFDDTHVWLEMLPPPPPPPTPPPPKKKKNRRACVVKYIAYSTTDTKGNLGEFWTKIHLISPSRVSYGVPFVNLDIMIT